MEVAWTVIPFIIVIAMALPATKTVVAMKDTSSADLTVKVTGYQWKWGYEVPRRLRCRRQVLSTLSTPRARIENREPKGQFYLMEVDNHMVVPVDKKVRVVLTAADVIHSWMIPDFGVKQDAIPASCATPGSAPNSPASTVASAPSSAAGSRLHAHRGSPGASGLR